MQPAPLMSAAQCTMLAVVRWPWSPHAMAEDAMAADAMPDEQMAEDKT